MNPQPLHFARSVRLLCGGLLVWAALFLAMYVFAAIACARGFSDVLWFGVGVVPLLLVLAAVVGLGLVYVIARHADRLRNGTARRSEDTRRVVAEVATVVCGLALIAIVWNTLPALLTLSRC